jgi:hypothetical protein
MSKLGYVLGYLLTIVVVVGGFLSLFAWGLSWLLPIATAGAFAPGFIQCLGMVVLLVLLVAVLRSGRK